MTARRAIAGFIVRVAVATALALTVLWLAVTPFDRIPLPRDFTGVVVRVLNFPVAVAGEVLPIRGFAVVFNTYESWCDFCTTGERIRRQLGLAVPVYVLLFYLPNAIALIARRSKRLLLRVIVGLGIYALVTVAYFLMTSDYDRRGDCRIAALWFVILAAAAAVAWSSLSERTRAIGVSVVVVVGAWAFAFLVTFIAPKIDELRPYYLADLFLVIVGVSGLLSLTWTVEKLVSRTCRIGAS